ncbi:DUF4157 domain-containing protein [Natrinema pallidum]|uniref:eCIS core domain-containing protein n=1 Tax=Natrinema pallidum TaxID=69527 RepID=UPI00267BB41A
MNGQSLSTSQTEPILLEPTVQYVLGSANSTPFHPDSQRSVQELLEEWMEEDFSNVRIHTGAKAARAAGAVVFKSGEYDPSSPDEKSAVERAISEGADVAGGTVSSVVLNYLYGTGFDTTLVDLFESLLENEPTAFAAGAITVSVIYKGIKTARGYLRDTGDEIGDIIDTDNTDSTRFD